MLVVAMRRLPAAVRPKGIEAAAIILTENPAFDRLEFRIRESTDTIRASRGSEMNVALFSGNYNYIRDGANQALNRLVGYLEEQHGAEVRVYSPVTGTPAFEPAGNLVPVRSIRFPGRSEYRVALGLPRAIRRDLQLFRPNLVHVSAPDWLGTGAQRFARRNGIPIVASLHTRFETYVDYDWFEWLRDAVERRLHRFYDVSDFILVPTAALREEFAERYGRDRVRVWGRGVDCDRFHPARRGDEWRRAHGLAPEDIGVLFFGRLVLEKGTDLFTQIMLSLQQSGLPIQPLIIGAGPAESRMKEELPDGIFTGHLESQELATAVASADVLVNPSLTEAFGNVVLEAMASGLAIVAPRVPSTTNLLQDGVTGLLCKPGDAKDFISSVRRLVCEPDQRRKLGEAAREAARAYDWDGASEAVFRVYQEAVRGRKNGQ